MVLDLKEAKMNCIKIAAVLFIVMVETIGLGNDDPPQWPRNEVMENGIYERVTYANYFTLHRACLHYSHFDGELKGFNIKYLDEGATAFEPVLKCDTEKLTCRTDLRDRPLLIIKIKDTRTYEYRVDGGLIATFRKIGETNCFGRPSD